MTRQEKDDLLIQVAV